MASRSQDGENSRFGLAQPNDTNTRSKRDPRKASVSSVDHGMVGIVNVYALIPKGKGAINPSSIGVNVPSGATLLPQGKPPSTPPSGSGGGVAPDRRKYTTKDQKKQKALDQKTGALTYKFIDKSTKVAYKQQLYSMIGDKPISLIKDFVTYDALMKQGSIRPIRYNLTDPRHLYTINKAVQVVKITGNKLPEDLKNQEKETMIKKQAMRLGVTFDQMRDYVNIHGHQAAQMNPVEEVFKRVEIAEAPPAPVPMRQSIIGRAQENIALPPAKERITEAEQRAADNATISTDGMSRLGSMPSPSDTRFARLNNIAYIRELSNVNPGALAYLEDSRGNREFYSIIDKEKKERRNGLKQLRMKRLPRLIFRSKKKTKSNVNRQKKVVKDTSKKVSKSALMKKSILKMLVGNRWRIG